MFLQMTFGVLKEKKNKERERKKEPYYWETNYLDFLSVADEISQESQT